MLKKVLVPVFILAIAFLILSISIMRVAAVKYSFTGKTSQYQDKLNTINGQEIDYFLANPGTVLPDSLLWPIKAFRDYVWLMVTTDLSKKAELNLLLADKRLGGAYILFEKGKADIAFSTLTKAEKYLTKSSNLEEEARNKGLDTKDLVQSLVNASLKHRQIIQNILNFAPEDAKPKIIEVENMIIEVYNRKLPVLEEKGITPPINPFNCAN